MTFHIYLINPATGDESVVEEGHRGQKGKPATWKTLAAAEAQVDYWRATSAWNRTSDPCPFDYAIKEAVCTSTAG
jgi:hypothetical protein